ncbi:hypothetical protein [Streptosporangium album]|uniref:hypothetical protein n=1 Tax=Streptosporangium album TaxID=47479 RepID=UPI0031EF382C
MVVGASVGIGGAVSSGGGHSSTRQGLSEGAVEWEGFDVGVSLHSSGSPSGSTTVPSGSVVGQVADGVGFGVGFEVGFGVGLGVGPVLLEWVGSGAGAVVSDPGRVTAGSWSSSFEGAREVADRSGEVD